MQAQGTAAPRPGRPRTAAAGRCDEQSRAGARHRPRHRRPTARGRSAAGARRPAASPGTAARGAAELHLAEAALGTTRDPDLLWRIDYGRARTQEARGETRAAIESFLAAVTVIESVRDQLQEPRFRAGFVDDKYDVYIELVRLQLQLGRTADAFSTAERLRARSFAEQLGGRSPLLLSDADRRREAQLQDRIRQLQRALADEDSEGQPAHPQRAMNRFSEELLRAEQEYQAFLDDHSNARHSSAQSAGSASSTTSVQRRLADDEALIEYVVGPDRLTAFVVTARGIPPAPRRCDWRI